MPILDPSFPRRASLNSPAPVRPQFRMRLLTLAVLSACASLSLAAQNRLAALPPGTVPTGGVVSSGNATILAPQATAAGQLLQINQTGAKATYKWNNGFKVAQGSEVRWNMTINGQSCPSCEGMNYIGGNDPALIQGTLTSNGKVYLVSPNGILFDGSAQVNVNTLIASSLDISQSTFDNGITSNLVGKTDPTLVATMVLNTAGQVINYGTIKSVKVDGASGQVATDPTTGKPVEEGGAIMLFAPQVENHGVITANNGQVILAAGKTVYLQFYNDPTGNDFSMRGFLVKVTAAPEGSLNVSSLIAGQKLNPNGTANLGGEIHTDRGNTTLTGLVVNQSGVISANTATTVNGSIWLKAENYDGASKQTTYDKSELTTSKDSVTQVLPEDDGTTLAESASYTDNSLYNNGSFPHYQGMIKLLGETIVHDGQAIAPGGRIVVGKEYVSNDDASRPAQAGRVYLGDGSVLSTAGLWVDLPYSSNYLNFKLGSGDLADSPLQKGGFLINQTVTVDPRKGSPRLFDIAKQIAAVRRSVLEKATAGGAITVNTGEFISATGSKVDVSGGGYRYGDGMATTTYLVSHGRLYDIATAPANLQYDGVVTKTTPVKGYVEGKSAGLLAIDAQKMIFGGNFSAGVTTGPYQRAAGALPEPGKLVLGTQSIQAGSTLDYSTVGDGTVINDLDTSEAVYALQDVEFGAGAEIRQQLAAALADLNARPADAAFPAALTGKLLLPTDLFGGTAYGNAQASASQGFGTLALRANGSITLPQGVTLDLGAGGSLLWLAPQVEVAGMVKAQGGSLVVNQVYKGSPLHGFTHVGASGVLSTAGGWINDAARSGGVVVPNVVDGGSVTIAGYGTLDAGSVIDVSGGAWLSSSGKLSYGNGGAITLPTAALDGVTLQGYGGGKGGLLALNADTIDVGGSSANALSAGFFTQGGFSDYSLNGIYQVNFRTDIHPIAHRRMANANALLSPTGTPFAAISSVLSNMPDYLRTAASLSATTGASTSGDYQLSANETGITLDPGVSIRTDPLGRISLSSETRMDIEGSLIAPGGMISLSLDPGKAFFYDTAGGRFNTLSIGDQAMLSTAGVFLPDVGPRGLLTGKVLPGGSISITARKNDLDIAQGATLDVSGASHAVDLPPSAGRPAYLRANVASEGGGISIKATENAYLDGTFKGAGGDASVAGGSFALDLPYHGAYKDDDAYDKVVSGATNADPNVIAALAFADQNVHQLKHTILLSQSATALPQDGSQADTSVIGHLTDASGNYVASLRANISADQLVNGVTQGSTRVGGGFDSVVLKSDNQIQIAAGVDNFAPRARLQMDTPELRVQGAGTAQIGSGSLAGKTWHTAQVGMTNTPASFRMSTNLPLSLIKQYPDLYPFIDGANRPVTELHAQVPVETQAGSAGLNVDAGQISLAGNVTVNGVSELALTSRGDIRFEGFPVGFTELHNPNDHQPLINNLLALNGRLSSAGNITMQASQIYPATATDYAVAVENVTLGSLVQNASNAKNPGMITAVVNRTPVSDGLLTVKGNAGADLAPVISAGGTLTLKADHIDQGGVIKAPLGHIALEGGQSLTLESSSVTSVSALWQHDGVETELVIPYGATQSVGQSLWYASTQTETAPDKQISANADTLTVAPGATLDLRGGGDFAAVEFIPGIGGTKDVLAAPGTYAIVPGVAFQTSDSYLNSLAPVRVNAAAAYDMVHLGAGSGLPEGDYALLPAYYALLPGAWLVKAQSGAAYANLDSGYAATQLDGSVVVAGKLGYAGTGIGQSTWSGFSIQSGADALTGAHAQAEYRLTGSKFFADQAARNNMAAPALPQDGGRLSLGKMNSLAFQGNLLAQAAVDKATGKYGAIGQVEIYGNKFAIVDHAAVAPGGYTRLQAGELSRLGASLLIGGKRTDTANGQALDVVASDVVVDLDGGTLSLPELWLAATDNLTVTGTSTIKASGSAVGRAGTMTVNTNPDGKQYGALLGLSSAELAPITRTGTLDTRPAHGNLTIDAGAKLTAKGAIAIDSTGTPLMAGVTESNTLAIGARQIALGAVPPDSTALALGNTQLAALGSAKNFVLRSYSSIDLYGDVSLGQTGTGSFTFDSAGLVGHDVNGTGAPVALSAGTLTLENLSSTAMAVDVDTPGTGTLALNADKLVLADSLLVPDPDHPGQTKGGFTVAGFSRVDLNAGEVSLQGSGTLSVASDLNIKAGRIAAGARLADQKIQAYDASQQAWHAIELTQPASSPILADAIIPGGKLQIDASKVDFDGNIVLKSGRLALAAHGAAAGDGITLKNSASVDLSSYEKTFAQGTANITESASAGRLTLTSEQGSVDAQSGSSIDLDGGAAGGDAGGLTVKAEHGTVALDGTLSAVAAPGQRAGSANIDASSLTNFSPLNLPLNTGFSALNSTLEAGGFGQSRYMRARTGDVNVEAADSVHARNIQLVADAGAINVKGSLDASGATGGGQVELDADQGIRLYRGSRIAANGTSTDVAPDAAYSGGGKVALYARNGQLDFDSGAAIDVSAAAAGKSSGGEVVFSAPRTANGDGLQAALAGQVKAAGGAVSVPGGQVPQAGNVILEGFKSYSGITATSTAASTSGVVYTDYDTFMNAADAIQNAAFASLQAGDSDVSSGNLKVRAGVELVSSGDMTVDGNSINSTSTNISGNNKVSEIITNEYIAWDLTDSSWLRTGINQTAGRLVLRAAGNLAVNARLGLPNDSTLPPVSGWSLQLAGGADTASADPLAVSSGQGDVTLNSIATSTQIGTTLTNNIRSGKVTTSTGDIQIASGRDFVQMAAGLDAIQNAAGVDFVHSSSAVVYTTGRAVSLPIMSQSPLKYDAPAAGVNFVDGGSISVSANGKVSGSGGYADINDWLRRTTGFHRGTPYLPAYWWVDRLGNSTAKTKGIEGIATLGGGDITIVAGNSVSNLSVASATSRSAAPSAQTVLDASGTNIIPDQNAVYGGGDVRIDAGGDMLGGQYLVSRGTAKLSAGGAIGGLSGVGDTATAPAFWLMGYSDDPALQGARLEVDALGSVALGSVANPTVAPSLKHAGTNPGNLTPGYRDAPSAFFSYSPEDSLTAQSMGGDLTVVPVQGTTAKNVLPPRFSAVALEGSVSNGAGKFDASTLKVGGASLYQYPDRNGQFQLLAGDSIHDLVLNQSDYDPAALPTASDQTLAPATTGGDYYPTSSPYAFVSPSSSDPRMATSSSLGGYRYAVVAEQGSVSDAAFYFPQRAAVVAGQDIGNVQLDLQNLGATDTSYVAAGRDLFYSNVLSNGSKWANMPHLLIAGAGNLLVEAGRDVNLGAVNPKELSIDDIPGQNDVTRIDAIGNTNNSSLASSDAANVFVSAGVVPVRIDMAQANGLFSVLRSVGQFQDLLGQVQAKSLTDEAALADAKAVVDSANQAIDIVYAGRIQPGSAPLYLTLTDAGGGSAANKLSAAYNAALTSANNVIAALFKDGQPHQGDITLYNARISSSTNPGGSGGAINLLAPYGNINVGLPTANSKRNIGVYTNAGGAINAYLNGDVNVNLSKLATFEGGDILLYTSGNGGTIDAGRGYRSASTSSPPRRVAVTEKDPITGDLKLTGFLYLPPQDAIGSGIRTVSVDPDGFGPLQKPKPGKVYLLAPTGTIDAGEAGVSSASGLVVAALVVKNADNFSASGPSVGVPSVSAAPAAPVSSDAAASASKAMDAVTQAGGALAKNDADLKSFRPAFISVEVLGFGGEPAECGKDDDACRKKRNGGN